MSLGNPRSIVKQKILLCSFRNLIPMISRCNWLIAIIFLTAAFGALINPPSYIAIALLLFLIALMLLPRIEQQTNSYLNWQLQEDIKRTIILFSLIVFCLIVPQVETNTAIFTSPMENFKNELRLS